MHYEVPGISARVGTWVAREPLEQAKGMLDGVYLKPSSGRLEVLAEVLEGIDPKVPA